MLDALEETRNADFHEFVQIVRGDGQELDALQQRVPDVAGFFQHTPVKFQPLYMAIEIVARIVELRTLHRSLFAGTQRDSAPVLRADECSRK